MKNNVNFKKAMKLLAKSDNKVIYYQAINDGKMMLISEGHCIITVPINEYEEYKNECFSSKKFKFTEIDLTRIFKNVARTTPVKYTTLKFVMNSDTLVSVFKTHNRNGETIFGAFNQRYIDVVSLTLHNDYIFNGFNVINTEDFDDRIKTPIIATDYNDANELAYATAILPINFNVKQVIEHVME